MTRSEARSSAYLDLNGIHCRNTRMQQQHRTLQYHRFLLNVLVNA